MFDENFKKHQLVVTRIQNEIEQSEVIFERKRVANVQKIMEKRLFLSVIGNVALKKLEFARIAGNQLVGQLVLDLVLRFGEERFVKLGFDES